MSVCYLEPDDEITGAIGRIRAVTDGEVIVVVPPGSRVATSRINFKLLGREANERRLNIVAVSDEPQVRALAISAGMPTYDSVAAAEQALASFREQDRRLAERVSRPIGEPPPPRAADARHTDTLVLPGPSREAPGARPMDTAVLPAVATDAAVPAARRQRRRRRVGVAPLLVIGLLALLVAGVGYGAYVFLPTATINIEPATTELRPGTFPVTADPNVAVVDVDAGAVPAVVIDLPLHVTDVFPATGVQTRETRASGRVRFRSENTVDRVSVAEGTVISTAAGVQFVTEQAATVPRANFATSTAGTVDVPVRAVNRGPRGNVDANAITEVPASLAAQRISVRNPQPTEGGRRIEDNVVTQDDYDAAVAALGARLDAEVAAVLADPASVPRGLTLFAETARISEGAPDQPANALVDTLTPTFSLGLDAGAQVLAVNESLVDELAAARLQAGLATDERILGNGVTSNRSTGAVTGATIVYEVTPSATVYREPDDATLIAEVRGKTVAEAKQILSRYGMVEIVVWPEFIDRLPDQSARISITVAPPPGS